MIHVPVLSNEVCEFLNADQAKRIIDATLDGGGHTRALLKKNSELQVLGIEFDGKLLEEFKKNNQDILSRIVAVNSSYIELKKIAAEKDFWPEGIVFDLGLSSWHYQESGRGFSFQKDEILDMRFNDDGDSETAADIVNKYEPRELERILREYGEEDFSPQIAKGIIKARKEKPILTTRELATVVESSVPEWYRRQKINCSTKTFQALRVAVNHELDNVKEGLIAALDVLQSGGRLAVISFQGLEDKIVKEFFRDKAKKGEVKLVNKKVIKPNWEEVKSNPRSRSAKMRVVEKI